MSVLLFSVIYEASQEPFSKRSGDLAALRFAPGFLSTRLAWSKVT